MSTPDIYICTHCRTRFERAERDKLVAKSVVYATFAKRIFRRRVIAHLCPDCLKLDPDYNRPPQATAPGMQHTKHGRRRAS